MILSAEELYRLVFSNALVLKKLSDEIEKIKEQMGEEDAADMAAKYFFEKGDGIELDTTHIHQCAVSIDGGQTWHMTHLSARYTLVSEKMKQMMEEKQ